MASVPTSYCLMWHYNCLWTLKGWTRMPLEIFFKKHPVTRPVSAIQLVDCFIQLDGWEYNVGHLVHAAAIWPDTKGHQWDWQTWDDTSMQYAVKYDRARLYRHLQRRTLGVKRESCPQCTCVRMKVICHIIPETLWNPVPSTTSTNLH